MIVNWNGGDLLRRAVESVAAAPPRCSFDIIVIDNASSDASVARLRESVAARELGERLRIVVNAENAGFSKANNQGFRMTDAPLLFLLNSDAEVHAGAIDKLIETLTSEAGTGAVGPRLVNPDGTLQVSTSRNPPAAWDILLTGLRLHKLLPRRLRGELLLGTHWDHARRRPVNFLVGAAIMVKREVVEKVGGLEERFHLYGEDVEWCLRIVRGGWRLVFEPEAVVMHHGGQSSIKRWERIERDLRVVEGHLRFQEHCLPRWRVVSNIMASSFIASIAHVWRTVRRRPTTETRRMLELYARHLKGAFAHETVRSMKTEGRGK